MENCFSLEFLFRYAPTETIGKSIFEKKGLTIELEKCFALRFLVLYQSLHTLVFKEAVDAKASPQELYTIVLAQRKEGGV